MNQSQQIIEALSERSFPLKPGTVVYQSKKYTVRATRADGEIAVKGKKMDGDPMVLEMGTSFPRVVKDIDAAKSDADKEKVVDAVVAKDIQILKKEGVKDHMNQSQQIIQSLGEARTILTTAIKPVKALLKDNGVKVTIQLVRDSVVMLGAGDQIDKAVALMKNTKNLVDGEVKVVTRAGGQTQASFKLKR